MTPEQRRRERRADLLVAVFGLLCLLVALSGLILGAATLFGRI